MTAFAKILLVLYLAMGVLSTTPAAANAAAAPEPGQTVAVSDALSATSNVAGPYATAAQALAVAEALEDEGFYTAVKYAYERWWVLYW